jgi:flagellar biosynthesis chaperone FliJ
MNFVQRDDHQHVLEKTRLDPVVDIRTRASEAVERELSAARREALRQERELAAARASAANDQRKPGDAAEWQLVEAGHTRSLQMVRVKEQQVRAQATVVENVRVKAQSAQMALEVVRRAADRKRAEAVQIREKADAKQLDAIATLLFSHG